MVAKFGHFEKIVIFRILGVFRSRFLPRTTVMYFQSCFSYFFKFFFEPEGRFLTILPYNSLFLPHNSQYPFCHFTKFCHFFIIRCVFKAIFAENECNKIVLGSINTFRMRIRDVFAILRCSLKFTDLFSILPYYSICNMTKNGHIFHYLKSSLCVFSKCFLQKTKLGEFQSL